MDAILIMLLLQLKHWYADFWSQSYQQTVAKGIYGNPVGFSHSLEHSVGTLIVLFVSSFFVTISIIGMLLLSIFDLILHYHIDYIKVRYGIKDHKTTRYWREFGLDQLAHQITYLSIVLFLIT